MRIGKIAPIDTTAILAALAKLRNAAEGFFKLQPTVEDRMWAEIGKFLKSGQERALREVLEGGNVDGNLVKLLVEVVRALSTTKPTAVAGMGEGRIDTLGGRGGESDDIESRTVPMSGVMLAERAEVEARELARQNPEEVRQQYDSLSG